MNQRCEYCVIARGNEVPKALCKATGETLILDYRRQVQRLAACPIPDETNEHCERINGKPRPATPEHRIGESGKVIFPTCGRF